MHCKADLEEKASVHAPQCMDIPGTRRVQDQHRERVFEKSSALFSYDS